MEPLQRYVKNMLQTDKFGGKVIIRDEHTIILYDTPSWGDAQAQAVRSRFPECEISVLAHPPSLSGFIVIIKRHDQPRASLWASVFVLALVGVAYTAVMLNTGLLDEF